VSILSPWPVSLRRVERLAVQERDDKPFDKERKVELRLKKFTFFQKATETSALVVLVEVSFRCRLNAIDKESGQLRSGFVCSLLDLDTKVTS
jgi:hypothetical protein